LLDGRQNPFQLRVVKDVSVKNSDDCYSLCRQPRRAAVVMRCLGGRIVCKAIDLDRQAGRRAIEIENIWADRVLSAETQP
jgi:hypothetical protein